MPFLNGLDAAERQKSITAWAKLVFLAMKDDPILLPLLSIWGSVAYVLKHSEAYLSLLPVTQTREGI
jgi:hypothetical protein